MRAHGVVVCGGYRVSLGGEEDKVVMQMKFSKQICQIVSVILGIYMYSIIHVEVENGILNMVPIPIKRIVTTLWTHVWFERIVSTLLVIFGIKVILKVRKYACVSLGLINITLVLFWVICFSGSRWINVCSGIFGVPFALLVALLLLLCFISCLAQYFYCLDQRMCHQMPKTSSLGFLQSNEKIQMRGIRKNFAYKVTDRLIATHNDKESFAVVIYGAWGSGKTVFLQEMRRVLLDKGQIVMDFNPWKCNSVNQIRMDFMDVLRKELASYDFSLARMINQYSSLLFSFDAPNIYKEIVQFFFPNKNESVSEAKEKIVVSLRTIQKHVYVLLDDLDRLDADEILEVLKIIRNTANFPFVKFIVACDRTYIVNQLKSKGVEPKYLEKIFMIDFHLPQVYADYPNTRILIKDIENLTHNEHILEVFDMLTFSQKILLDSCLGSFRQAKRFAGEIVVAMEFTESYVANTRINILLSELLWVELLKFIDIDCYSKLKESPVSFLDKCKKGAYKYGLHYYCLKKDSDNGGLSTQEKQILQQLFPVRNGILRGRNSIAYLENFDKYFSYGMSARHISESEFLDVLYRDEDLDAIYNQYQSWKSAKLLSSMGNRILMTNTNGFELNEALRFVYLIFLAVKDCREDFYKQLIYSKLMKVNYKEAIRSELASKIIKAMESPIVIRLSCLAVASFCHEMYVVNQKNEDTLLSNVEIERLVRFNFSSYLAHNKLDASDVIDSETMLYDIVQKSCIPTPLLDIDGTLDYVDYKSLIYDILLKHFSEHKSEDVKAIDVFEELNVDNVDDELYSDEVNYAQEQKDNEICSLFGSIGNYRKFKDECFKK